MNFGLREGALFESSQRRRVQDTRIIHDGELCQPLVPQIQGLGFRNELIQRRFAFFDHLFLWRTLNLSRVAVINAPFSRSVECVFKIVSRTCTCLFGAMAASLTKGG